MSQRNWPRLQLFVKLRIHLLAAKPTKVINVQRVLMCVRQLELRCKSGGRRKFEVREVH